MSATESLPGYAELLDALDAVQDLQSSLTSLLLKTPPLLLGVRESLSFCLLMSSRSLDELPLA